MRGMHGQARKESFGCMPMFQACLSKTILYHAGPSPSMPGCVHFSLLPQLCSAQACPGRQVGADDACLSMFSNYLSVSPLSCTDVRKQEEIWSGRGFRAVLCNAELDFVRCLEMAAGHLHRLLADACGPISSRKALLTAVLRSLHALQRALMHMHKSCAASALVLAAAEGTCCFSSQLLASCVLQGMGT